MKTAICTGFNRDIPFEKAVSMIKEAGFEVISMDARPEYSHYDRSEGCRLIGKLMERNKLEIDSVHAPFPEGDRLFSLDEDERAESIRQCKSAFDAASELDGKIVVIHLIPYGIPEGATRRKMVERGKSSVNNLANYALGKGLKLALENGQQKDYDEVLVRLLSEFRDDSVGFCYDSGHENVQGTCFNILKELGHRLLTTHLHDNTGTDTHMLPYEGTINWTEFRTTIRNLDYSGNLLLEPMMSNSRFREPVQFLFEAARSAATLLTPVY